jgi:hypothetical protein
MPPDLPHVKQRWTKRACQSAERAAPRDDAVSMNRDPSLRRRSERRPPRLVHDDALWHEGPDEQRTRRRRHEGPREPRRDHPSPDFDTSE